MVATGLLVAPFHRLAAVYVACYAAACLLRFTGLEEQVVNILWHGSALLIAVALPVLRGTCCMIAVSLFAPLLMADVLRITGALPPHEAWWIVYWIVLVQLALLPWGMNYKQYAALRGGGLRAYLGATPRDYLRVRA